ncbi:MAG: radical SAM protein [Nitrospira sp.]|nr:radical SAM protein [Nitrospira sp.]
MKIEGRRYRDEWLPNFFPGRIVSDAVVRVSRTGRFILLTPDEDRQLSEIYMDDDLYTRLERTGHIVTMENAQRVLSNLTTWFDGTFAGPTLHIVVTTRRCNLTCTYCHMLPQPIKTEQTLTDMSSEIADQVVDFILDTPNPVNKIEFQGGEPFLNFDCMKHVVETARAQNAGVGKKLDFTVVTNLMMATDDQLSWCRDEGVRISYSLNGPRDMHDHYRKTLGGHGSHDRVIRRLHEVRERFPGLLSASPLCVVDADNAPQLRDLIDYFIDLGYNSVALLKLRPLGNAQSGSLHLNMDAFLHYYLDALDYLMERSTRDGVAYSERMVRVVVSKLLGDSDVGYVDWRNPCGDFSGAITYDYDGAVLPSDEARSLRPHFVLGNVREHRYGDLIRRPETFATMNMSLRDRHPVCRECAYNPYCGVAPILEFARHGSLEPVPYESEECRFTLAILDWTFRNFQRDPVGLIQMLPDLGPYVHALLCGAASTSPEKNTAS